MKRSRPVSSGARRGGDDEPRFGFLKRTEPEKEKTWEELTSGQPDEAFLPYSLKSRFAKGALVSHPKFGKGAVVDVVGGTIDVLFAEGKKKLGHAPS